MATVSSRLVRALLAVATISAVFALPSSANAQDVPAPSIELVDQSDWVAPGGVFGATVKVNGAVDPTQTELVTTVYDALPNRSQFEQTLQDKNYGTSVILDRRRLDESLGPDGLVRVDLPVQDPKQRQYLRRAGVYPVKVELRAVGSSETFDRFTTHLINVPAAPPAATRLKVAPVIPVRSPYTDITQDPLGLPDAGASISAVTSILTAYPDLPVSLLVAPETVDRAKENPAADAALTALAAARTNRPVVATPWAPLSSPMFAGELTEETKRQFDKGKEVLTERFGSLDTETAVVTSTIDTSGLSAYRDRGAQRVLISESSLVPQARGTTLARPVALSTGRNSPTVPATQLDEKLGNHFTDPEGAVLGAHRLLADLAVIYNDLPGQERGVAITAPERWVPDATFLSILMRGLTTSPVVTPVSTADVFAVTPDGGGRTGTVRQLQPRPKNALVDFRAERINELRRRVNGYASMVEPTSVNLGRLQRRLLAAESSVLNGNERDASLDATQRTLDGHVSSIRLPSERSIRFTARQGEVPVSVQNDTGDTLKVVVKLSGDKVLFPSGSSRELDVERSQVTERFDVDARTSGVFPVQVRLESPDGTLLLSRSRILISSTATSGVGVLLSAGAGLFLALWWTRSVLKTRKAKKNAVSAS